MIKSLLSLQIATDMSNSNIIPSKYKPKNILKINLNKDKFNKNYCIYKSSKLYAKFPLNGNGDFFVRESLGSPLYVDKIVLNGKMQNGKITQLERIPKNARACISFELKNILKDKDLYKLSIISQKFLNMAIKFIK